MTPNDVARIAGLVAEPARTAMLFALLDGRALTAGELARSARISPQTASRHLAAMVDGGLLAATARGRHRYHRIASAEVAAALEGLIQLAAGTRQNRPVVTGPTDAAMRRARTCYDHLAGRLGVAITEHLVEEGALEVDGVGARALPPLPALLGELDPALVALDLRCRPCMDWAERRPHLSGPLAVGLCRQLLGRGWLRPAARGRGLEITGDGALHLGRWLGARHWRRVMGSGEH